MSAHCEYPPAKLGFNDDEVFGAGESSMASLEVKKARNTQPRKQRPKSETKTKALEELKNALTLASLASQQMETEKEQLTVKEIAELMQDANVAKLNETTLPDYKGFGFYHKSGKKIRYFSLTTKRPLKADPNKLAARKRKAAKTVPEPYADPAPVGLPGNVSIMGQPPPVLSVPHAPQVQAPMEPYDDTAHAHSMYQQQVQHHPQPLYTPQAHYGNPAAHAYGVEHGSAGGAYRQPEYH